MSASDKIDAMTLPFSEEKQRAVLGWALYDERFYLSVITRVMPEWFVEENIRVVYKHLKTYYKEYKSRPSVQAILESTDIMKLDNAKRNQVRALLAYVESSRKTYEAPPLLKEMSVWMQARTIQLALPKAAAEFNKEKFDASVTVMNQMVKDYRNANFIAQEEETFENYRAELEALKIEHKTAMTFGLTAVDRLLLPSGEGLQGGLLPGDMTILLAPTNVGKTTTMITTIIHNVLMGKSVLFITHEGTPKDIKGKLARCFCSMTTGELMNGYNVAHQLAVLERMEMFFKRFLTYIPYNRPGMTVEEAVALIDRYQEKRIAETGRGYDMIVDDYPAKLSTESAKGGHFQLRHIQEEVYNQFVQVGLQYKEYPAHVLCAIQTNRDGSTVNRRIKAAKHETRLLHMEDVMEAWGPMTAATNVISLNRSDEDAALNKMTFLLCKSRSSDIGWAVTANTDYSRARTHANDLGAFWYRSSDSLGQKTAEMMSAYLNREVPSDKVREALSFGGI